MADEQTMGLLAAYGLPEDRDTLMRQKAQQRQAMNLAKLQILGEGGSFRQRNTMYGGMLFGQGLSNIMSKNPDMTPEEVRKLKIADDANRKMRDFRNSSEFSSLSPDERSLKYMEYLAQAASDNGSEALAAQITEDVAMKNIARERAGAEYGKLLAQTEESYAKADRAETESIVSLNKDKRELAGTYGAFIVPDADGKYDFRDFSRNTVTGRVNENGELVHAGGVALDYIPISAASGVAGNLARLDAAAEKSGGLDPDKAPRETFLKLVPAREREKGRVQVRSIGQQIQIMDNIADSFDKFMQQGKDPAQFLDGVGRAVDFVDNVKSSIRAVGGLFTVDIPIKVVDEQGNATFTTKDQYAKEISSFIDQVVDIPDNIEEASPEAAKYRAAIVELSYAIARANEPSANQLSDKDYRNALSQIGAAAADPEKLRQVILANLDRKYKAYESDRDMISSIGESAQLTGEKALDYVYGGKARRDFEGHVQRTKDKYAKLGDTIARFKKTKEPVGLPGAPTATAPRPPAKMPNRPLQDLTDDELKELEEQLLKQSPLY